jgi:hypothetical protein
MPDSIQQEARQILDTLAFTPFEQCQPLSREFDTIIRIRNLNPSGNKSPL